MCSNRKTRMLAAAALTTALGCSASAALADSAYRMFAYVDSPSGSRIVAGDYAEAIAFATKRLGVGSVENRFVENTNLCVAYTVLGKFVEAREPCETALELAKLLDGEFSYGAWRSTHQTAKALTNRGVLKALTGDVSAAASDFREARSTNGPIKAADINLTRVERAMTDRLAMTEAR